MGVFGLRCSDIEEARAPVESALGIQFAAHESLYRGGDYYRFSNDDSEFILRRNWDLLDEELAVLEFMDSPVLLYFGTSKTSQGKATPLAETLGPLIVTFRGAKK